MGLGEFDMIARYFLPLTHGRAEACGLGDDAAVLDIPDGYELVVSTDTLSAGSHFLPDQPADTIAQKALRTNVSDMLAMGAKPYAYQLGLALPKDLDDGFLPGFCSGLAVDHAAFDIFLSGGDTTATLGPLTVTITIFGLVEKGRAVKRSGAKAGDQLLLTGVVGDALCGLEHLRGRLPEAALCVGAFHTPALPFAALGGVQRYACAAIDISDGLLADLMHICRASNLSAQLRVSDIAFSSTVQGVLDTGAVTLEQVLSGGDDYQLLLAVPADDVSGFIELVQAGSVQVQNIGEFTDGAPQVQASNADGAPVYFEKMGWTHF